MKQVVVITGVRIGDNFRILAEEGNNIYEPWSPRVQVTLKEFAPEHAIDYGIAMQQALFQTG